MTQAGRDDRARWRDPEWHRTMRETKPVWQDPDTEVWHMFRYDDVATVITEYQTFSSDFTEIFPERAEFTDGNILAMDPPQHRRLRNLVSQAFTPRAISGLDGRIAELTTELLDATHGRTQLELIDDLAYPLPVIVIAELLGLPAEDRVLFRSWAETLLSQDTVDPRNKAAMGETARELRRFHAYLGEHLDQRRRQPRHDLLSEFTQAEIDGAKLENQEIIGFATVLLLAGHLTTTVLLGNSIRCLDGHPGTQELLRARPETIPAAIEEILRHTPPFAQTTRVTGTEVRLGDQVIPPRQLVNAWLVSANHDERRFTDPDAFIVDRTPNPHLGFGRGIHFCIGAPLARLETKIVLGLLLRRYADLRVDHSHPLEFYPDPTINGVRALHLQVQPA